MGTEMNAGRQATAPRVGAAAVPFPELSPTQRDQLAAWMAAKAIAWKGALEAGKEWLRKHPEDETVRNQVVYWQNLIGAWKQAAYLVRVTGTKRKKPDKEGG